MDKIEFKDRKCAELDDAIIKTKERLAQTQTARDSQIVKIQREIEELEHLKGIIEKA